MSTDERFPYSRRSIVGVGGIGLVAAAAPAFAQSSKEPPFSKGSETPRKPCKTHEASTRSRRFAGRSSLGPDWRARWIRVRITARRPIAARVGSLAERLW